MLTSTLQTEECPDLWRRYLAVCIDGLRAHPDQAPLPQVAPDEALMHVLMTRRPR